MIKTIFLGLSGIMSIILVACIASYYNEIRQLFRKKLSVRKVKNPDAGEWQLEQFEKEQEMLAYLEYERKGIYEESEYEQPKPVYSSQTRPSVI